MVAGRNEEDGGAPFAPIYLLADSVPLFARRPDGRTWPTTLREGLDRRLAGKREPTAAYIGASNGDDPQFYAVFEAAMDNAGIEERRMIRSRYSAMDDVCLNAADLILLAGGNVARGWEVIESSGMRDVIVRRYLGGATVIGVSAGAVQLGVLGWRDDEEGTTPFRTFDTFRLVPFVIDVHDEDQEWRRLRRTVIARGEPTRGLGIPRRGGLVYHPDHTLEPLASVVTEVALEGGEIVESLLAPER